MKKITDQQLIIYGLALVIIYIAVLRPIFIKLGLAKDPLVKATEERKEEQLETQIQASTQQQRPTKSTQEWQVIADKIYNNLRYSAVSDNKADAGYQVARVQNDADFWTLFKLFGKRREYLFGIPSGSLMNLPEFIGSNLSREAINTINNNYARKGIKFRF